MHTGLVQIMYQPEFDNIPIDSRCVTLLGGFEMASVQLNATKFSVNLIK